MAKIESAYVKKIAAVIRKNLNVLDRCARPHDFQVIGDKPRFGAKYRCTKCKGIVDGMNKRWYESGLMDGRKESRLDNDL